MGSYWISFLFHQQECEDLAKKVAELNSENSALKVELEQLNQVCKDLEAENALITVGGFVFIFWFLSIGL